MSGTRTLLNNSVLYDIIVVGAGHSGLEAASVSVRLGCRTALITSRISTICKPSCNPNIGGAAKGHIVKEIDALGGMQGRLADLSGIHFKMLNTSKGPAIWSPRAQIDKDLYPKFAYQHLLELSNNSNLNIIECNVRELIISNTSIKGCILDDGSELLCEALILCSGTFLNGKMFVGQQIYAGGR